MGPIQPQSTAPSNATLSISTQPPHAATSARTHKLSAARSATLPSKFWKRVRQLGYRIWRILAEGYRPEIDQPPYTQPPRPGKAQGRSAKILLDRSQSMCRPPGSNVSLRFGVLCQLQIGLHWAWPVRGRSVRQPLSHPVPGCCQIARNLSY